MTRIAVIGAGLSGLVTAQFLSRHHEVTVFEKSRGVGGRMATRYAGEWQFDHGAQFFTAKSDSFRCFLEPIVKAGVVQAWCGRFIEIDTAEIVASRRWDASFPHFVACPNMNSLAKHLANDLNVQVNITVARLERCPSGWQLFGKDSLSLGEFDWVLVTAPAAQTAALLPGDSIISARAKDIKMLPCFALMLGFHRKLELEWNAALVRNSAISWVSVNSSKPGRNTDFSLVVHSSNAWAQQNIDADADGVLDKLCDATSAAIGQDVRTAAFLKAHRWLYANVERQDPVPQVDAKNRLAVCGDWFVHGRVEGAFESAEQVIRELRQAI